MCAAEDYDTFAQNLPVCMKASLAGAGVKYDDKLTPSANFGIAIDKLADKGTQPVILIDEYDDPVAKALKNVEVAERVRSSLAPIYGQMKDRSGKIRFLMITGVSKFTKLSIFSTLSSLVDISFEDAYASMLGYTEDELDRYFSEHMEAHRKVMKLSAKAYREHMEAHRKVMGLSAKAYRAEIKRLYNGYRFWLDEGENVCNPVSINLTMANRKKRFELYWAETGKASFLMNFLKRGDMLAVDPDDLEGVTKAELDVSDLNSIPVKGMLFQTGYLTIKDFNGTSFDLCVPDEEVQRRLAEVKHVHKDRTPWLDRYSYLVTSADKGAVLKRPHEM